MSISKEADRLINGDRRQDYAHPSQDLARTAELWSAILGTTVDPRLVPLCMVAVKISRQCHRHKRDNLVDIAGWAQVADIYESTKDSGTGPAPQVPIMPYENPCA